ncbi:MAG: PrsW family intramembrane metalloprotease [Melioribacteraceae bacterium]|jgi:RsiW-degrading membrane proteinase PrsW (M82 family)|nr:PrsW family intramembrane metalloprotease [Melioribacteraceae bacterium]
MLILSIFGTIVPIAIYLFFLWKFDKNEPEPIKFVLYHFLYGATAAIVLGIIGSKIFSFPLTLIFSEEANTILKIILVAPIIEEIAKASLLFKTINNKRIDNLTDGLIYGGAIGLGFGITENFLYFILFGNSLETFIPLFIIRSSFSAVMHSLSTATVGGLMSLTKYSSQNKYTISTVVGLLVAMLIHFAWNLRVGFYQTFYFVILFMLFVILLFILTYYLSIRFENKIIQKELLNEIPNVFIPYLTSVLKYRKGWFLLHYQNTFIRKTTLLAFRKHQVEISGKNKELYINEIQVLRKDISELIELNSNSNLDK